MRIVVAGVNHASATLAVRERLTVAPEALPDVLARLKSAVREGFVVSTCNRTEVVALVGHEASGTEVVLRFLADHANLDMDVVRSSCYVRTGAGAVRHALRVASGLDSMVLGEDQIQGQFRQALASARDAGTLGPTLERLGSAALASGKRVRTFTGIGQHTVSLESLAVRATTERVGPLSARRVLVIGAGESAGLVVRHLQSAGAAAITIVSRRHARAAALAATVSVAARPWRDLPGAVTEADLVFAATAAPRAVVTAQVLAGRMTERPTDPLLCVDLGMPRAVDAAAAAAAGVPVIALDELAGMAQAHRAARREHIPAAEAIVDAEVARYLAWLDARGVAQTIGRLDAHARAVAEAELRRIMPRLDGLPARQRAAVGELAHRIVRKLVHGPINTLKAHPEAENMALVVERLFGLANGADALDRQVSLQAADVIEESAS